MHAVIVSRTLLLKHLKLSPMKNSIHEYIHMLMHFDYSNSTRTVYHGLKNILHKYLELFSS